MHRPAYDDGSTANVLLLHRGIAVVANIGDSRAVACVNGRPVALSSDHTGKREDERARIEALGGEVSVTGRVTRANLRLMVTRALGDRPFKLDPPEGLHEVIAEPEVCELPLSRALRFVLLATDGLWDVYSSAEAIRFARQLLRDMSPKKAIKALVEAALDRGSEDNISAALVVLDHGDGEDGALVSDESDGEASERPSAGQSDDEPITPRDTDSPL